MIDPTAIRQSLTLAAAGVAGFIAALMFAAWHRCCRVGRRWS